MNTSIIVNEEFNAHSKLKSTASEVGLAVVVGSKLLIFDKDLEKPIVSIPFEHSIDFVVWRRSLLLVGTSASDILLLCPTSFSIKERVRVKPNYEAVVGSPFFVNGFIHSNVDPKFIDMLAVDVRGAVNLVANTLENYGLDSSVKVKRLVAREGLAFVLLLNGQLLFIDDESLIIESDLTLPSPSFIVHDFAVVCSRMGIKFWTIFGVPGGVGDETFIGIFSGPSFELEFSLKIVTIYEEGFVERGSPRFNSFPATTSSYEEPFAFLEVYSNCCRLYKMAETSTEATIQKLLTKGRFDEAEQLTRHYGKDMDVFCKAKVRARFIEIFSKQESSNNKNLDSVVNEVLETLCEIRDAEFVCTFCLEHQLPRVNWFKDILNTGMKSAIDCNSTEAAKRLLLTRKKFYTFEQVMSKGTIEEWEVFNNEQMYLRSLLFLQNFEFEKCELVWRRHADEFMDSIKLMDFVPFFMALFSKVLASQESVSLFRVIFVHAIEKFIKEEEDVKDVAVVTEKVPEGGHSSIGLNGMVQLVAKQILSLERELDWPKGALFFINNLITTISETAATFEKTFGSVDARLTQKRTICAAIMDSLQRFLQILNELAELKASHSIRIAFSDYTRDSRYDVVNSMLNELFIQEEIERFISKFLFPFPNRENLVLDDLFENLIKVLPATKLFGVHRIFSTLREQEIPLEEEFLYIYTCYQEGTEDADEFLEKLGAFSIVLLKFGEVDLFNSVFTGIQKEYMEQALQQGTSNENEDAKNAYLDNLEACEVISQLQFELFNSHAQFNEEESDTVINELLEDLKEVGITLNAYALRKRSKKKLLVKLIEMRYFDLASGLALYFGFKEKDSWSRILQGLLSMNDGTKLRNVLESIKNSHELWMLPEFATAWLAVSRDDPGFKSMCPIPLL